MLKRKQSEIRFPLEQKLLLVVIPLIALSLMAVSVITYRVAKQNIQNRVSEYMSSICCSFRRPSTTSWKRRSSSTPSFRSTRSFLRSCRNITARRRMKSSITGRTWRTSSARS